MAEKLFPLKNTVHIAVDESGKLIYPSADFVRQWDLLFKRVGKYEALSNTELEALSRAEKLGVFSPRTVSPLSVKQGSGPLSITQDITGFTVSIDMDQIIGAVRAFMPRQEAIKQPVPNDADWVIANRVFRA